MNSFFDKLLRQWRCRKVIKHIPKDSVICDIGCGEKAFFLKAVSRSIKKGIGLDEKAAAYADSKLEIKKCRLSAAVPLEDESCDVVTMMAVLEHLSKPQEILNECSRILKKGGKLILTVPAPSAKKILEFLAFKLKVIDENEIKDHKNYFKAEDIKKMLSVAGFKKENIRNRFFEFHFNILTIAKK
jgi:ubiquinone/menaquinone biosynthesis C-methylase UbiE